MSMPAEPKQRKPKVSKFQTYAARRQADRFQRLRRRERTVQRQRHHQHFKFRVKVVRTYQLYRQQLSERQAAERTLAHWQPRADDHFPLSLSSIRQWHRIASRDGFAALRPQSTRPHTIEYRVSPLLVGIILTLRRLYGWGGQLIAAELETRGLGHVSSQTVYALFARPGLPVQIYALKGRSDGIA
jgi:hypothetical protein